MTRHSLQEARIVIAHMAWSPKPHRLHAGNFFLLAVCAAVSALAQGTGSKPLTLSSPAFADGAEIPVKYTRLGAGTSPPLTWTNVPPGTQALLLHVHDVDTPQQRYPILGPTRLHWLVWNIPATSTGLPEGVADDEILPDGSFQLSARSFAYFGPVWIRSSCPTACRPESAPRARDPMRTATGSSSGPSTKNSISNLTRMRKRRAPKSCWRWKAMCSPRRTISACSP